MSKFFYLYSLIDGYGTQILLIGMLTLLLSQLNFFYLYELFCLCIALFCLSASRNAPSANAITCEGGVYNHFVFVFYSQLVIPHLTLPKYIEFESPHSRFKIYIYISFSNSLKIKRIEIKGLELFTL